MANTMNDTRTPGEILADAVELAEKTGHSYITVTNQCAERIIELLKEREAVEPFHKCIGENYSLFEDSHFNYCPCCGKPITWAKQEG